MNKRLLSGIVALSIVASMGAMTANAVKLGNVNNDDNIDIEDAVSVINHVNGVTPLTPEQEKIADVDKSGEVDIEDAVRIINHINGVTPLADEDIEDSSKPDISEPDSSTPDSSDPDSSTPDSSEPDSSTPDESSKTETETVKVTLTDTGDTIKLNKGDTIPQKYGKFPDPADKSTWDPASWYLFETDGTFIGADGKMYTQILSAIKDKATGIELQDLIADGIPVTQDIEFEIIWETKEIKIYPDFDEGERTIELFEQMADGNYFFSFTGNGVAIGKNTAMQATINQVDSDHSRVHVSMPGRGLNTDLFIISGKKYKIISDEEKTYSTRLSTSEQMMDFNGIFKSISENKDAMEFVEQTVDEENGWIVEQYNATITTPANADVVIYASYDRTTNELKKLIMYTTDYLDEDIDTTIYLETNSIDFKPEFEFEDGLVPDDIKKAGWTKVKTS